MYKKNVLNCLVFSRHTHLLALAVTTNLFSTINQPLLQLPHEIILKVVILEGEPNNTGIEKLVKYLDTKKYAPEIQRNFLPCYQLLITCKGFYCNQDLKKSLHMTVLNLPLLIQNIFVLNHILKKSHSSKLQLTNNCYIDETNMDEYDHFF